MQSKRNSSGLHHLSPVAAIVLLLCLLGGTGSARAQLIGQYFPADIPGYEPDFSGSVVDRMYLQDEAQGVELGDFVVRPELDENAGYNSNTLASPDSASSELETKAGVQINSDRPGYTLGASINLDDYRYFQVPAASYLNWTGGIGGSMQLGDDTATFAYSHLALNLAATDVGAIGGVAPVAYSVDDVRVSYLKLFGRFELTPAFDFENFAFSRGVNATLIDYADLSHTSENESLAGRYETTPGNAVVLILRSSQAQFENVEGGNYLDIAGFVGVDFRGDPVIQYRLLLGVESRRFVASATKTVNIPTFEMNAVWTPTELNTVTLTGMHRLDDPTSPFARDQDILDGRIELDHQLRRNIFLNGFVEALQSRAQSGVLDAGTDTQTKLNVGAGMVWNLNRHLSAVAGYAYNKNVADNGSTVFTAGKFGYPSFNSSMISVGIRVFE